MASALFNVGLDLHAAQRHAAAVPVLRAAAAAAAVGLQIHAKGSPPVEVGGLGHIGGVHIFCFGAGLHVHARVGAAGQAPTRDLRPTCRTRQHGLQTSVASVRCWRARSSRLATLLVHWAAWATA